MAIDEKFSSIRKGLLEFLILKIIAADKVYVADMMQQLESTEFATQERTLYPLLSKMRREDLVDYEWRESNARTTTQVLQAHGQGQVATGRAQPVLEADQLDCGRDGAVAMNKVITIDLNGNAYQLDEAGYEALRTYSTMLLRDSRTILIGPRSSSISSRRSARNVSGTSVRTRTSSAPSK